MKSTPSRRSFFLLTPEGTGRCVFCVQLPPQPTAYQSRVKLGDHVQRQGTSWKPISLVCAGRAHVITALFRLQNFLQDVKMEVVRFDGEDTYSQALRSSLGNDNRLPSCCKAPTPSAANPRRGETPTREALRKSMAALGLKRPAHNIVRNSVIEV